ncbi:dTDP-4-amino-4,6-dideoxygalactose transaminase [compost metagenome]
MRSNKERGELIEFLRERGIYAVFHYVPLHDSPAGLRYSRSVGDLPVTQEVSACLVRLPLYSDMSSRQVAQVCAAIFQFFAGAREA